MEKYSTKKILRSIFVFSTISLFLTGALVAFFSLSPFYNQLIIDQQDLYQTKANQVAEKLTNEVDKMKSLGKQISVQEEGRKILDLYAKKSIAPQGYVALSRKILENTIRRNPFISGVKRVSVNGDAIISAGKKFDHQSYIKKTSDNFLYETKDGKNEFTSINEITINEKVLGYDIVKFDAGKLFASMNIFIKKQEGANFFLVDNSSTLVHKWAQNIDNKEAKTVTLKSNLGNLNLSIQAMVSKDLIYQPVIDRIKFVALLVLVLIAIGGLIINILLSPLSGKLVMHTDQLEATVRAKTIKLHEELDMRKLAEKELKASYETMEVNNKMLSNLTTIVNKDLKETVDGFKETFSLLNQKDLSSENAQYLQFMKGYVDSLGNYIKRLNSICTNDFDLYEFVPARFNLLMVLESWVNLLRTKANQDKRSLVLNINDDINTDLVGDPIRLGQVLSYLIDHVIADSIPESDIDLEVNKENSSVDEVGISFTVVSKGLVISDDNIAVLNQFFGNYIGAPKDLPLAYSMAHKLAKSHGGKIWLEKGSEKGCKFNIFMPFGIANKEIQISEDTRLATGAWSMADVKPTKSTSIFRPVGQNIKVLVAEDSIINSKVLKSLLERKMCEVVVAENITDTIDNLRSSSFDLIFIDEKLSARPGAHLSEAVSIAKAGKDIPVVGIKSEFDEDSTSEMFCDRIEKPINPHSVYKTLARWV